MGKKQIIDMNKNNKHTTLDKFISNPFDNGVGTKSEIDYNLFETMPQQLKDIAKKQNIELNDGIIVTRHQIFDNKLEFYNVGNNLDNFKTFLMKTSEGRDLTDAFEYLDNLDKENLYLISVEFYLDDNLPNILIKEAEQQGIEIKEGLIAVASDIYDSSDNILKYKHKFYMIGKTSDDLKKFYHNLATEDGIDLNEIALNLMK